MLEKDGHELVLLDIEPIPESPHKTVQADIRDAGAVALAMTGCDAVIHAMAYHGNMFGSRNHDDFYGVNVTGTHNVIVAMMRLGIRSLVFSSSEVVYGKGMDGQRVMDESVPCIPVHKYALTKVLCEQMCEYYSRMEGLRIASLRYGCFVPADWKVQGVGRLSNWLDKDDVAQANVLALKAVHGGKIGFENYLIHCRKPFVDSDWPDLEKNPEVVLERYWPGCTALLKRHGLEIPPVTTRFDICKATHELGYSPRNNFDEFLSALQRDVQ